MSKDPATQHEHDSGERWHPVATHTTALKGGGKMEIGIFENGGDGIVVTQTLTRTWNGRPLTKHCLWCGEVSIGCVECTDQERPETDCIRGMIRCIPKDSGMDDSEGGGELPPRGGFDVVPGGVDVWPMSDGEG